MAGVVDPRSVPNANTLKLTNRNLNAKPVVNMGFDTPDFLDEFDALLTKIIRIPSDKPTKRGMSIHTKEDYKNVFCDQIKSYLNLLYKYDPETEANKVSERLTCELDKDFNELNIISAQLKETLNILTPAFTMPGGSRHRSRRASKKVKRSRRRLTRRR